MGRLNGGGSRNECATLKRPLPCEESGQPFTNPARDSKPRRVTIMTLDQWPGKRLFGAATG